MSPTVGTSCWFEVRGSRNGSTVTLRWSPGAVNGDPPTVDLLLAELEIATTALENAHDAHRDPTLTAIVAGCPRDPLNDPETVYALTEHVLDAVRHVAAEPAELAARLRTRRAPN